MLSKFLLTIVLFILINIPCLSYESQWAWKVIDFSSEYGKKQYSAQQVLGKPSVMPDFGSSPCAWRPQTQNNNQSEWIHVTFQKPMKACQLSIAENFNYGCVEKIFLMDSTRKEFLDIDIETDTVSHSSGRMNNIFFPMTNFKVASVKIILNTNLVSGWKEIDAIGISDSQSPTDYELNIYDFAVDIYEPERLSSNVNSQYNDIAPVISQNGKKLFFTRTYHPENIGSMKKQDIWFSEIDKNGEFSKAVNIGPPLNNEFNNFAFSLSPDGMTLLVGNEYNKDGTVSSGVSTSRYNGEKWSFPEKLVIKNLYNLNTETGYYMAADGKTLLLTIETNDSYGGLDLYVSFLDDKGVWSEPKNLGATVNTAADEASPFLASDGVSLYFASPGFCGYGSYDIFITRRLDSTWKNWTEPENIGPVINTEGWDAYFSIPASGAYAYISSDRNQSKNEDIYRIKLIEQLKPKKVIMLSGRVLESHSNIPLGATIRYELLPSGKEAGIAHSNPITGDYSIVLPSGENYGFRAEVDKHFAVEDNIDLHGIDEYLEMQRDLILVPIEVGETIKLTNIFFNFKDSTLLSESFPALKRVANFLQSHKSIEIEIAGHSDNIGSNQRNYLFSFSRAKAVADYLLSLGIPQKRMIVQGYAQTKPVANNRTEEGRKLNRRVEFKITKK
ncbi:MAG: OmpA family protein [Candidatus Kapabacteria bacterium]|nr:OmpA family protein [Candidatus Kapabacteria bacterium]